MRLGISDHKVLRAFAEKQPAEGHKLSTDGQRLDGHWLGGTGIARWERGQITLRDPGSHAAQSVQRALRKHAAPRDFSDFAGISGRAKRHHTSVKKSGAQLDCEIDDFMQRRSGVSHMHVAQHALGPSWRGSKIQSLLFDKQWTPAEAKDWARSHGYKAGKVHVTDDYIRLRQSAPVAGREKRTITFGQGIKAIVEQTR